MKTTARLIQRAARIAQRRSLSLSFTWRDIGDLYHVYGVNATAGKLVDMLQRRAALQSAKFQASTSTN